MRIEPTPVLPTATFSAVSATLLRYPRGALCLIVVTHYSAWCLATGLWSCRSACSQLMKGVRWAAYEGDTKVSCRQEQFDSDDLLSLLRRWSDSCAA